MVQEAGGSHGSPRTPGSGAEEMAALNISGRSNAISTRKGWFSVRPQNYWKCFQLDLQVFRLKLINFINQVVFQLNRVIWITTSTPFSRPRLPELQKFHQQFVRERAESRGHACGHGGFEHQHGRSGEPRAGWGDHPGSEPDLACGILIVRGPRSQEVPLNMHGLGSCIAASYSHIIYNILYTICARIFEYVYHEENNT